MNRPVPASRPFSVLFWPFFAMPLPLDYGLAAPARRRARCISRSTPAPRQLGRAALAVAAVLAAGCGGGGGGGGPTAPDANAPVIADLTGTFPAGTCTVGGDAGTPRQLVFSYTDADGDVSGGQVSVQARFDSGVVVSVVAPAPAGLPPAGTITFNTCVVFKDNTAITETVVLVDAANRSSNVLTLTTVRPPGAPELRRPLPAPGSPRRS